MNTKRLFKIAAFASTVAVLTGVVTFNIGSVVGAPSVVPPGNAISPTFSGLNVTGKIANPNASVSVEDDLVVTGKSLLTGEVQVQGGLINPGDGNPLTINDNLTVQGKVIANGPKGITLDNQTGTISGQNGVLTLGGNVESTPIKIKGADATKYAEYKSNAINVFGDTLSINGATGKSTTFGGNAVFDKDVYVTGSFNPSKGIDLVGLDRTIDNVTQINGSDNSILRLQGGASAWIELSANSFVRMYTGSGSEVRVSNQGNITLKGTNIYGKDLNDIPGFNFMDKVKLAKDLEAGANATIAGNLTVTGNTNLNNGLTVPVGETLTVNGTIKLPSGDGRIINDEGNAILQTWWDGTFGDYTAINSGYAWTGSEPVSVVAGANGVYFMKGSASKAYKSQLGKIDLSGNMTVAGKVTATGYVTASSKRFKENIKDIEDTSWLYKLNPVSYSYISDKNNGTHYGLIAEEVEKVNSDLVTYDENGQTNGVLYNNLIGPIVKTLQDQKKEIDQLKVENAEIKAALCEIKADLKICN